MPAMLQGSAARTHFRFHRCGGVACAIFSAIYLLAIPTIAQASDDWDGWSVTVFAGVGTDGGIEDLPGLQSDVNDAYMLAIAPNRVLARFGTLATLEAEGQLVKHFQKQRHAEVNAALVLRWLDFPWDDTVDTSFAIGEGVSYATSIPVIERERSPGNNSSILNHLFLELEMKPPSEKHWSFVVRLHHRSGVYGLFNGVSLGSNFIAAGLKYRF